MTHRPLPTGGHVLQFTDEEVVIAFGGQPARHPPGGGAIAGSPITRPAAARNASALAFPRSRVPAPAYTTRAALSGWSRPMRRPKD
jgi:hypothetical protein